MGNKCHSVILILLLTILFVLFSCQSKTTKAAKSPWHQFNLGRIYFTQGNVQKAIAATKEAIRLDPKKAQFYQSLAFMYFSVADYPEAEATYLKALEVNPDLTEVHNHLGVLYLQTDRLDMALREFHVALKDRFYMTPEVVYFNLSELARKKNDLEEAVTHLRKALELNPKYYRAHYELAKILSELGEMQDAIFEYKVAETNITYQRDPDFQFSFAMAYLKAGDHEKAKKQLLKVVNLAPGTPMYIKARDILDTLE